MADCSRRPDPAQECVVLLHGLARTPCSMKRLEWALKADGYSVLNVAYPSTSLSIEGSAEWVGNKLKKQLSHPETPIHFVTHSLGGIVLSEYLSAHEVANPGRIVMLAPPNHGSEVADKLKRNIFYKLFMGPAGQQLGTRKQTRLSGPVQFEVGVIAGDRSLNPCFSAWLPGPDDGKVSVGSTKLPGMRGFIIVHHSHSWMMWRRDVVEVARRFLKQGSFQRI